MPLHRRDLRMGKAARDEAIARVDRFGHSGAVRAAMLLHLRHGWTGKAEDLRVWYLDELGLPKPHHHNCWGGAINALVASGLLIELPVPWQQMELPRSHARRTPVYLFRYPFNGAGRE